MIYLHRIASIALGLLASSIAAALEINVVGLFPNKAVVQVEGGALRTLSVGQKAMNDVSLLAVGRDDATFEIEGRRVVLLLGTARTQAKPVAAANYAMVPTNERGDLVADGEVNGKQVRFAVDTGATFITFPAREANRLGLDYRDGQRTIMETANGDAVGYRFKLDTIRVGTISLHDVDAIVIEGKNLSNALLGMSFLNRVDFRRRGGNLTLTSRD